MKRVLVGLALLVMLYVLGRMLVRALASDETHIRWAVEDMEAGYNSGDVGDAVAPLARDWRHEGHGGLDRDLIRAGLLRESLQERDRETKQLGRRVELDWETFVVEVDGDAARLQVDAVFERLREGAWSPTWSMRAEADLQRREDGWRIVRSRHEDLDGTQLSR